MITDRTLLILQGILSGFHFLQSGYTFGLTNTKYRKDGKYFITNGDKITLPKYSLGNLIAVFPLLAGLDHLWSIADSRKYLRFVQKGYNPVRWLEYSASAGLMFFAIAQLSEIQDIKPLVLILGSNIVLQYLGYSTERNTARGNLSQAEKDNAIGFVLFMSIWLPIFVAFFTALQQADERPPDIVYIIIFVMFALFIVFGLLNWSYIRGKQSGRDEFSKLKIQNFRKIELGYILLSFVAKTLLTNLTLFGALNKPPSS